MKRRIVIDSKNCGTGECRVVLQGTDTNSASAWWPIHCYYMINPIQYPQDIYFASQYKLRESAEFE